MKLLIITQELDEDAAGLGFFISWVREFSKWFEEVKVLHFRGRGGALPSNVSHKLIRGNKVAKALLVNREILRWKPDRVFIHMCPEFALASLPACTAVGCPRFLWFMHGAVPQSLRLSEPFLNLIFTGSSKSLRLDTPKKRVLHHGIDAGRYAGKASEYVLDVGRMSKVKNHGLVINAFLRLDPELRKRGLVIAGGGGMLDELKIIAQDQNILFLGNVPNREMSEVYANCSVFVTASETGSVDKTVLEAMASGKPVIVCNEAFTELLSGFESYCFFEKGNEEDLTAKMEALLRDGALCDKIGAELRERVKDTQDVSDLIRLMSEQIKSHADPVSAYDLMEYVIPFYPVWRLNKKLKNKRIMFAKKAQGRHTGGGNDDSGQHSGG